MKRSSFKIVIASALIISILNSCNKHDSLPDPNANALPLPITLNLTAHQWVSEGSGIFVSTFKNVIPAGNSIPSVKVYLADNNTLIDHPISFAGGALWTTNTQADVQVHCRPGNNEIIPDVNLKVVIWKKG